jgi:phosphoenolpyruvate-protein phosphotransferase
MRTLQGIGASEGITLGPAYIYLPQIPVCPRAQVSDTAHEERRLEAAVRRVEVALDQLKAELERELGHEEAAIFDAHRLFLSDPAFTGRARCLIVEEKINAEAAVEDVMAELRCTFEAMQDEYFRERGMDVVDVGRRLLRELMGLPHPSLQRLPHACIVVARELTPSDTARMDRKKVLGLLTARGGKTAHAAILARGLGIPAVVGAGEGALDIGQDTPLILDGTSGVVLADPDPDVAADFEERRLGLQQQRDRALAAAHSPAVSRDGRQVEVVANIGSVEEAQAVLDAGGEGVGLLRTEFLFLDRETPPSEDEQTEAYRAIARVMRQRPLVIRTLDTGGDKPLAYLTMPAEDNPFLGRRGLRLCLAEPEMFKVQLRALLRASVDGNIKIMFPMVATAGEIRAARRLLDEARQELAARGEAYGHPEIGIMVEIPAAAVAADTLAPLVDFFSLGTNDLTQYALAADRTSNLAQELADALHPAVLRLIAETIRRGHEAGIWVGVCGELAGDPVAAPILLGLDLDEFSMAPGSIPAVKETVRKWSHVEARRLAEGTLKLDSADEVRRRVAAAS